MATCPTELLKVSDSMDCAAGAPGVLIADSFLRYPFASALALLSSAFIYANPYDVCALLPPNMAGV